MCANVACGIGGRSNFWRGVRGNLMGGKCAGIRLMSAGGWKFEVVEA